MLKKNFLESSAGSAPLELAGLVALLVLPLTPMLFFYQEVFDAIAAESIDLFQISFQRYGIVIALDGVFQENLVDIDFGAGQIVEIKTIDFDALND